MIIVASPSKPFQYTAKTTARRQVVINDYEDEIKELYATVDESTQSSISPPDTWDILSTTDFIRTVVNKVLVNAIQDNDDLFEHGCDRCVCLQGIKSFLTKDPVYKQRGFEIQLSELFGTRLNLTRETRLTILSTTTHQFHVYLHTS